MLWAITGKTAAELIQSSINPELPNMGLTSWKGSIVRKPDVLIAKNYLNADEIKDLNEIVTMYLTMRKDRPGKEKLLLWNNGRIKWMLFWSLTNRNCLPMPVK